MNVFHCSNGAQTTCGMCFIYIGCILNNLTSLFHIMFFGLGMCIYFWSLIVINLFYCYIPVMDKQWEYTLEVLYSLPRILGGI